MKALKSSLIAILLIFPLQLFAADTKIICKPLEGTRIDYFLYNAMNIENKKFHMGRDRVSELHPVIILHDNKQDVTFYFQKENTEAQMEERNMKVISQNLQQISFAGLFNGAPVLASYYPLFDVLMYSQQSTWPGRDYSGARGMLFYAKCQEES